MQNSPGSNSSFPINNFPNLLTCSVGIIGLGYVGLPLAIELDKKNNLKDDECKINRRIIGFDINKKRINELLINYDRTGEITIFELENSNNLLLTDNYNELQNVDVFIVTVPTPIDNNNIPDLSYLESASELVGKAIAKRKELGKRKSVPVVIYESTVYPGATEEYCVPIIERNSGLELDIKCGNLENTFSCGYSPERINPGEKIHSLTNIIKVTSGSTESSANWINKFYETFITAGTYKAKSIITAEAAKVIENTQRDLNIALVNELAKIFNLMNIDTNDVLDTACTKWNFLNFRPGLVGGHCISIDPYYLTHKAQHFNYMPEVVLAGRRTNESMPEYISNRLILEMCKRSFLIKNSKILIMGVTFKENCCDIRNSKVFNIINYLERYNLDVTLTDPIASEDEIIRQYRYNLTRDINNLDEYNCIILAVPHKDYLNISSEKWIKQAENNCLIYDVKGVLPRHKNILRL